MQCIVYRYINEQRIELHFLTLRSHPITTSGIVVIFRLRDTIGVSGLIELDSSEYQLNFLEYKFVVGSNDEVGGEAICRARYRRVGGKGQLNAVHIAPGDVARAGSENRQGCKAGKRPCMLCQMVDHEVSSGFRHDRVSSSAA
jgi:hypothetical protein